MTRRIGRVVFIEPEPPADCELCGAHKETRPYGPDGKRICWDCGQKDTAATWRRMGQALLGKLN